MKTYRASDVAMMRIAALDEGFREGKAIRDALAASLESLFEHCAMIHKHWGDSDNSKQADRAIKAARAAITTARGEA